MSIIYEPKGAAREYSHLAVNLYVGCEFGCTYCYAPAIARKAMAEWSANPVPKKNILERLESSAKAMAGDPREILLCYTSDPYQNPEAANITREALLILEKYNLTATVLTKAGEAAMQDFDILERNNWKFGTTLSCIFAKIQKEWEPFAADACSRFNALTAAHARGIQTWVSMEPVYNAREALAVISQCNKYVDFWKIGKMNHRKLDIDWVKFHDDAVSLLESLGANYYIKKELKAELSK